MCLLQRKATGCKEVDGGRKLLVAHGRSRTFLQKRGPGNKLTNRAVGPFINGCRAFGEWEIAWYGSGEDHWYSWLALWRVMGSSLILRKTISF